MSDVSRDDLTAKIRKALGRNELAESKHQLAIMLDGLLGPHGWKRIAFMFPDVGALETESEVVGDVAHHVKSLANSLGRLDEKTRKELDLGTIQNDVAEEKLALKKRSAALDKRRAEKRKANRPKAMRGAYLANWAVDYFEMATGTRATKTKTGKLVEALFRFFDEGDASSATYHLRHVLSDRKALRELTYEQRRWRRWKLFSKRRTKNLVPEPPRA